MQPARLILVNTLWMILHVCRSSPIVYQPVFNSYSAGTEEMVATSSFQTVMGAFNQLKVGSSYIANPQAIAATLQKAYFLFRPSLQTPLFQGVVMDNSIIRISKVMILESKILLVTSSYAGQIARRTRLAYNTVTQQYSQMSTIQEHTQIAPFSGLAPDPTQSEVAYWLANSMKLYKWSATTGFGAFVSAVHSDSPQMQLYGPGVLVYGSTNTMMQFVDVTTMTISKQLQGSRLGHYFRVDRANPNFIHLMQNQSPFNLASVEIDGLVNYAIVVARSFAAASKGGILDFSAFPFLAMVDSTNVFTIMHKANLQTVESSFFEPMLPFVGYIAKSMDQGTPRIFEYPIFHQVKGNSCINTHLYFLKFDMCTRDPSGRCTTCPANYYLSTILDQCLPIATGIHQSTLAACAVPNCAECVVNTDTCSRCSAVPTPLFVFNNTCVPSGVSGYGPAGADLVTCQDSFCLDCSSDSSYCLECDAVQGYIQTEGRCILMADLQSTRRGVNRITSLVQSCSDPQCLACVTDATQCTHCDSTNGYVMNAQTNTCVDQLIGTKTPRILSVFDETNQTISLRFMGPIAANITDACFDVSLTDLVEFRTPLNCSAKSSAISIRLAVVGERFLVFAIVTDRQIIEGSLTVAIASGQHVPTAAGNPVMGFPVVQDQVQRLTVNTSVVGQAAQISGSILNSAKLLLQLLLAATQTKSLGSPNYIFSQQSILSLLEGPWVDLPDQILYNSIQYIQGVPPLPNLFIALHGKDESCDLPSRYARLELHCSFTLNFGAPILAIAIVTILSALIDRYHAKLTADVNLERKILARTLSTMATEGLTASDLPTSQSKAICQSAQYRIQLRRSSTKSWWIQTLKPFRLVFAVEYVESLLAEILLYSFLNLTKRPTDTALRLGIVFSLSSFAAFALMLFAGLKVAVSVRKQCPALEANNHREKEGHTVGKVLNLDTIDGVAFAKRFDDFKAPLSFGVSLQAFADYGRCFLFAFVVIGLGLAPLVQIGCMICIQTTYMICSVIWYGKKSPAAKWVALWIESQFLAYMLLKLWVLVDSDRTRIQNQTGLLMAIVLVSLQLTAIVLQSYGLIFGIYHLIKTRKQGSTDKMSQSLVHSAESERVEISPKDSLRELPSSSPQNPDNLQPGGLHEQPSRLDSGLVSKIEPRTQQTSATGTSSLELMRSSCLLSKNYSELIAGD